MPIDYGKIAKDAWITSIKEFNLNDPKVQQKIKNWSKERNVNPVEVGKEIANTTYFPLNFVKNPSRQSIHEKAQLDFLRNMPLITNLVKLPPKGKYTVRIPGVNKAIDCSFTVLPFGSRTTKLDCYAYLKYTYEPGGAQTNQRDDLLSFLDNCPISGQHCFVAFPDGAYYTKYIPVWQTKYDKPSKRRVFTLDEFEIYVSQGKVI